MDWYVLKMRSSASAVRFRDLLTAAHIEFFLPTTKTLVKRGGKETSVDKPVLFSYVFVRTEEHIVESFTKQNDGISFLREHTPDGSLGPHLRVPDSQMNSFIRAVEHFTDDIPFVAPTPEMLSKGDRVRIIGGPFLGIEGILEARQGKDGGRVIVRIGDLIAVPTVEISPEFIEVLEFAPEGRHLYQKLDSFEPRLYKAVQLREEGQPLPSELEEHLRIFVRRFANLTVPALNARVRYLCYLFLTYTVLDHDDTHSAPLLEELTALRPTLRSKSSLRLLDDTLLHNKNLHNRTFC